MDIIRKKKLLLKMRNNHLFFGLFIGSFNPPTKAHFQIATDLLKTNQLTYLYFLPVNSQKDNLVSLNHRLKMLNLKIAKQKNQQTLNIYNYSKNGKFTTDTLKKIPNITHLILGGDLFLKLKTFQNYEQILKKYHLIIISRNHINIQKEIDQNYLNYQTKITIITKTYSQSSTLARNNLNNKTITKYLNQEILDYIKANNLYS